MVLWEAIYAVVLLVGTFVVLLMDWAPPDYTMLGLNTLYIAARIITVSEGTAGFSNPAVLAVAGTSLSIHVLSREHLPISR